MKAPKRYLLLIATFIFVYLVYHLFDLIHRHRFCLEARRPASAFNFSSHVASQKSYFAPDFFRNAALSKSLSNLNRPQKCRMDTCFDFSRCKKPGQGVKIYIYPTADEHISPLFKKIINFIKQSKYYEPDPEKGIDIERWWQWSSNDAFNSNSLPFHLRYWHSGPWSTFTQFSGLFHRVWCSQMNECVWFRNTNQPHHCCTMAAIISCSTYSLGLGPTIKVYIPKIREYNSSNSFLLEMDFSGIDYPTYCEWWWHTSQPILTRWLWLQRFWLRRQCPMKTIAPDSIYHFLCFWKIILNEALSTFRKNYLDWTLYVSSFVATDVLNVAIVV